MRNPPNYQIRLPRSTRRILGVRRLVVAFLFQTRLNRVDGRTRQQSTVKGKAATSRRTPRNLPLVPTLRVVTPSFDASRRRVASNVCHSSYADFWTQSVRPCATTRKRRHEGPESNPGAWRSSAASPQCTMGFPARRFRPSPTSRRARKPIVRIPPRSPRFRSAREEPGRYCPLLRPDHRPPATSPRPSKPLPPRNQSGKIALVGWNVVMQRFAS